MAERVTLLNGSLGLNVNADPAHLGISKNNMASLIKCLNVYIGDTGRINAEIGAELVLSSGVLFSAIPVENAPNIIVPSGESMEVKEMIAYEDLAAGDLVNVFVDNGQLKPQKADAANNKPADAYVIDAVTTGSTVLVYYEGLNDACTGLSGESTQYLSTTPGKSTATPPSGAGVILQEVGLRVSDTELAFERGEPKWLAG